MSKGFKKVRFNAEDESKIKLRKITKRSASLPQGTDKKLDKFNNDETAARFYLSRVFEEDERSIVRGLSRGSGSQQSKLVPDMQLIRTQTIPSTKTKLFHFEQTQDTIPIFGSNAVVEITQNRGLVDVSSKVADVEGVTAFPFISQRDALKVIKDLTGIDVPIEAIQPPELTFFYDEKKEKWHLSYFFKKIPAAPKGFLEESSKYKGIGYSSGISPKPFDPQINYLIDANDGTVLLFYSETHFVKIPVQCEGIGALGKSHKFWGSAIGNDYELADPISDVRTYDLKGGDLIKDSLPDKPVANAKSNWEDSNKAAVSAHVNGSKVYNFIKSVLGREGIDDKGMELTSVVNVTCFKQPDPSGQWHNACWRENKMWYGQHKLANGELCSYSRFLDIIAHEMTHGITKHTSDLLYKDQSGALNESFSDIFGIIIYNWETVGPDSSTQQWTWEIGPGLGGNGLPLRDMSNPKRIEIGPGLGVYPDHMDQYKYITYDNGGVHINSSIHNKAAYNLLTATDQNGKNVLTPREVALLYYFCLCKLNKLATFKDAMDELVETAKIIWKGNKQLRDEKIYHIKNAYQRVGIG
ncbi:M4 family peptidase [Candidatus Bathyarchaeota archaeon]|nr:M4 family peptidase [Candidatus Bathyarchaeota archaeon]